MASILKGKSSGTIILMFAAGMVGRSVLKELLGDAALPLMVLGLGYLYYMHRSTRKQNAEIMRQVHTNAQTVTGPGGAGAAIMGRSAGMGMGSSDVRGSMGKGLGATKGRGRGRARNMNTRRGLGMGGRQRGVGLSTSEMLHANGRSYGGGGGAGFSTNKYENAMSDGGLFKDRHVLDRHRHGHKREMFSGISYEDGPLEAMRSHSGLSSSKRSSNGWNMTFTRKRPTATAAGMAASSDGKNMNSSHSAGLRKRTPYYGRRARRRKDKEKRLAATAEKTD